MKSSKQSPAGRKSFNAYLTHYGKPVNYFKYLLNIIIHEANKPIEDINKIIKLSRKIVYWWV